MQFFAIKLFGNEARNEHQASLQAGQYVLKLMPNDPAKQCNQIYF